MENIKLLICGDLVVSDDNFSANKIDSGIIELFAESDLNIVNLESPVNTNSCKKIIKTGPHLRGSTSGTREILKALNVNLVTLANNHILDFGEKGLFNTIEFCKEEEIDTVGAGRDIRAARIAYRTIINGCKISVINFAENEWSSATPNSAGAHPMDIIDNVNSIKAEKLISDKVVVIIHGGHEYYQLPSPRMVKQYRYYADAGADLIAGHHTHCISGYEIYKGIPIYYGLGNFLFTKSSQFENWYTGLILEVIIDIQGNIVSDIIPVRVEKGTFGMHFLDKSEKLEVISTVTDLGRVIESEALLGGEWNRYIDQKMESYIRNFSISTYINNRFFKALFNKLKIYKLFANKNRLALNLNLIRCEAHADLSKEILTKSINQP